MPEVCVTSIFVKRNDYNRLSQLVRSLSNDFSDFLENELDRAEIVENSRQFPKNVVSMYSNVVFRDLGSGKERSVTLVYPGEAEVHSGRISILSPVGTALLGVTEGKVASYRTSLNKLIKIKLLKVNWQSEKQ